MERSNVIKITFTREEFAESLAPYEYLYSLRRNPMRERQEIERLARVAGEMGYKSFKATYNAYLKEIAQGEENPFANVTKFTDQPMTLECGGYECDDLGVRITNDYGHLEAVCAHPIMPVRRLINIDTGEVKQEIAFRRSERWRKVIFDKSTLSSAQKIVGLSAWGIGVDSENARQMVKYLSAIENMNYDKIDEVKSVGRLGWVDDYGFSPYVKNLVFDGDDKFNHAFECVKSAGDFEKWMYVARMVRDGKSKIARIILAASFASPLVKVCDALPFIAHIWGGAGAGKTVGLMFAASVWASPTAGDYVKSFNGTMVANELQAAFCGSLPLCLDELQCIKERKGFDDIIYMLCEGIGKARGAKTGGLQRTQTWRNCTISTGEMPITQGNSGAGAMNRVIELDCKSEKLFNDPRDTVAIISKNYGHAGKLFVEMLSRDGAIDHVKEVQQRHYEAVAGEATDKQALTASLLLTADELIDEWIFKDGACLCAEDLKPYLVTNAQADANLRAYAWIIDTVASNPTKFTPDGERYTGECWGCIEGEQAYIIKGTFDRLMREQGYNAESFLSWAKRTNRIDCAHNRTTKKKRIKGIKIPTWCVCLNLECEEVHAGTGFTIDKSNEAEQLFL